MSSTNAGTSGAQHWRKLGVLRDPAGAPLVAAMLPTPHRLSESRLRLFYGALDADTVSRVHSVDIDLGEPTLARAGSHDALLDIGEPGHFDDNGVVPSAAVEVDAELRLYYVGFQKQTKVPYTMFTGLAVSSDGGASFRRARTVPLLERSTTEPFFRTAPWATVEDDVWRMWYIGGGTWLREGEKVLPSYALRRMISADGISWPAMGTDCIVPSGDEIGFGRPCCIAGGGLYRLWY